jgi:hypothetical protein
MLMERSVIGSTVSPPLSPPRDRRTNMQLTQADRRQIRDSENTVREQRAQVFLKKQAASLADLVRTDARLGTTFSGSSPTPPK